MEPADTELTVAPNAGEEGELRLGSTERGAAANGVILALTRAARSFLLYDPSNEAIRHFLASLREAVDGYLAQFGELPLTVRPFELAVDTEVVYLDRDRERSLAFRLYRDGVRRLTLQPALTWHELLKLLEVLSIRYTGVRQAEDDMVVLLWKAGFANIQIEAVEGFVPDQEDDEAAGAGHEHASSGGQVKAPPDFDLPPPPLGPLGPLKYRSLEPGELAVLHNEDASHALPELCVRLVGELLRAVADPVEPLRFGDVLPLFREIRDFLLAEGLLAQVLEAVRLLAAARYEDAGEERQREELLASFADGRAVGRLIHSVARDAVVAPREMLELLDRIPSNHLRIVVELLGTQQGEASRRVARSLIERYVPQNADWSVEQIARSEPAVAVELFRALVAVDGERAIRALEEIAGRQELELQLEALHVLEHVPLGPTSIRLLTGYAAATNEDVRIRALELIGRRGITPAFAGVLERVKRNAPLRLGAREADAAGEALARLNPAAALDAFRGWIKLRGLFAGILSGQEMLQRTAVAGLVHVPGDEAEALIKMAAERGGSELAQHCTASMVKRRRLLRGATS